MSVEQVLRILHPGVKGLLSQEQASNLVLSLIILATDGVDSQTLRFFTRFLTHADYDDLIDERTVLHRCGYPLCNNDLRDARGNIRKAASQSMVTPWSNHFCSRNCYRASQFYRHQLSTESLPIRKDVAFVPYGQMPYENNVLLLHEVEHLARTENKPITVVINDMIKNQANIVSAFSGMNIETDLRLDHENEDEKLTVQIKEKNVKDPVLLGPAQSAQSKPAPA